MSQSQQDKYSKAYDQQVVRIPVRPTRATRAVSEDVLDASGMALRRLVRHRTSNGDIRTDAAVDANQLLENVMTRASGEGARAFQGLIIGVQPGDGMSTAAQSARQMAELAGHPTTLLSATSTSSDIESLLGLFPLSWVVKAAQATGVLPRPRTVSKAKAGILGIATLVVIVATATITKAQSDGITAAVTWGTLAGAGVLAILGMVAAILKRVGENNKVDLADLAEKLADVEMTSRTNAFIDTLVIAYERPAEPRCLIIDDFYRLHPSVKRFVRSYLNGPLSRPSVEIWIVFDRLSPGVPGPLWAEATLAAAGAGDSRMHALRTYELLNLSEAQRAALARHVGHPERAHFATVTSIRSGIDAEDLAPFTDVVQRMIDRHEHDAIAVLYLLALTATTGANLRWEHSALQHAMSAGRGTRRGRVLNAILPEASSTRVNEILWSLRKQLKPYLGLDRRPMHSMQLRLDAAQHLLDHGDNWNLPDPKLGHLFWALFWHDFRNPSKSASASLEGSEATSPRAAVDALFVDKTAAHLLEAGLPGSFDQLLDPDTDTITTQLFEVILTTITNCLLCCCLRVVGRLVEFAVDVTRSDAGDALRSRRMRLRRLGWDAYCALGEDIILDSIVAVDQMLGESSPAGEPESSSTWRSVYFAGLGTEEPPVFTRNSGKRAASLEAVTEAYLAINGAWLCLTGAALVREGTGPLHRGAQEAHAMLAELFDDVLDSEQDRDDLWDQLDYSTISLGLWCRAFAGAVQDPYTSLLQGPPDVTAMANALDGCLLALKEQQRMRAEQDPSHADFVADALDQDLLLSTMAASLVVLTRWSLDGEDAAATRIHDVLDLTLAELGLDAQSAGEYERDADFFARRTTALLDRMDLMRAAWHGLGYEQLEANLALRRVQLAAVAMMESDEAQAVTLLHAELGRSDRLGLAARLVAAHSESRTTALSANLLCTAANLAITGCPDDSLISELCHMTVFLGSSYDLDTQRITRYLLGDDEGAGASRLHALLGDLPQSKIVSWARRYLNISYNQPDLHAAVLDVVRQIAATTSGEVLVDLGLLIAAEEVRLASRTGVVDVAGALSRWTEYREHGGYPYLLYLLWGREAFEVPAFWTECTSVCNRYAIYLSYTGIALLLWRLEEDSLHLPPDLRQYITSEQYLDALYRSQLKLESILPPEFNVQVLEHLYEWREEKVKARLAHWQVKLVEFDEAQTLAKMVREAQYAQLFSYWWRILRVYGLTVAGPSVAAEETSAQLLRRLEGQQISAIMPGSGTAVSRQFLSDITAAFSSSRSDDDDAREARKLLDNAAEAGLPKLFEALKSLPAVPAPVRSIVRRHQNLVLQRIREGHGVLVTKR